MSSPAMIDSSVLLPEPEAPTMATDSRAAQREIDLMENGQRPGGIGHLLGDALHGDDGFGHVRFRFLRGARFVAHCSVLALLALAGRRRARARRRGQGARCWWWATACRPNTASRAAAAGWRCWSSASPSRSLPVQVVNASISGDTTSGGRSRLPALLTQHRPQVVVIELGGNDALRGLPLDMTQANLTEMARAAKAAGAKVLIVGMPCRPTTGASTARTSSRLFGTVAEAEGTALVPFLLAGVADAPNADELFQPDRIHPTAQAHPRMLDNVWPVLRPLLR